MRSHSLTAQLTAILIVTTALSGCGTMDRIADIGKPPEQTPIINPVTKPDYQPVSMPMPVPDPELRMANSLWSANRQTFFKDQRARKVGDILTVAIRVADDATMTNETDRQREEASESLALPEFLGFDQTQLAKVLPETVNPANMVDLNSTSGYKSKGEITRDDQVNLRMAAVVTQVLPNGNLVISGRQELRVNFENRILQLAGVIRPEDITMENSVPYDKIAEARIVYGGKGQITDIQQPRYGQQIFDVISPF